MSNFKPILVKSQAEWEMLAPVLMASYSPYLTGNRVGSQPKIILLDKPIEGYYSWLFASIHDGDTQTVDEFLLSQSENSKLIEIEGIKTIDWEAKYKELEQKYNDTEAVFAFYQTEIKVLQAENARLEKEQRQLEVDKYHSDSNLELVTDKLSMLEQAVKDAISEMEEDVKSFISNDKIDISGGVSHSLEILKQKTGL